MKSLVDFCLLLQIYKFDVIWQLSAESRLLSGISHLFISALMGKNKKTMKTETSLQSLRISLDTKWIRSPHSAGSAIIIFQHFPIQLRTAAKTTFPRLCRPDTGTNMQFSERSCKELQRELVSHESEINVMSCARRNYFANCSFSVSGSLAG